MQSKQLQVIGITSHIFCSPFKIVIMEAFKNGLQRVEKYMSKVKSEKRVRFLCKSEKLAFSIIRYRLKNNCDNCLETGVVFKCEEAKCLNLPIEEDSEFGVYYLDTFVFSKKPHIVYYK